LNYRLSPGCVEKGTSGANQKAKVVAFTKLTTSWMERVSRPKKRTQGGEDGGTIIYKSKNCVSSKKKLPFQLVRRKKASRDLPYKCKKDWFIYL